MDDAPQPPAALHRERAFERGRIIEVIVESHARSLVAAARFVERPAQGDAALLQHRHVVRHALHFLEQMR